ncbi:hypothetical protein EX30DRAFT_364149 [Ascodesmis nigricans]|uniref:Uncharacterized protein n=1 Tax=Ascodesmis nigricans TaxID=341454 RepID=A0A4S2MX32_9PEZI|nr:hypothetical protein EX30DRAFT_364149 [Ascodesmis nigricans]
MCLYTTPLWYCGHTSLDDEKFYTAWPDPTTCGCIAPPLASSSNTADNTNDAPFNPFDSDGFRRGIIPRRVVDGGNVHMVTADGHIIGKSLSIEPIHQHPFSSAVGGNNEPSTPSSNLVTSTASGEDITSLSATSLSSSLHQYESLQNTPPEGTGTHNQSEMIFTQNLTPKALESPFHPLLAPLLQGRTPYSPGTFPQSTCPKYAALVVGYELVTTIECNTCFNKRCEEERLFLHSEDSSNSLHPSEQPYEQQLGRNIATNEMHTHLQSFETSRSQNYAVETDFNQQNPISAGQFTGSQSSRYFTTTNQSPYTDKCHNGNVVNFRPMLSSEPGPNLPVQDADIIQMLRAELDREPTSAPQYGIPGQQGTYIQTGITPSYGNSSDFFISSQAYENPLTAHTNSPAQHQALSHPALETNHGVEDVIEASRGRKRKKETQHNEKSDSATDTPQPRRRRPRPSARLPSPILHGTKRPERNRKDNLYLPQTIHEIRGTIAATSFPTPRQPELSRVTKSGRIVPAPGALGFLAPPLRRVIAQFAHSQHEFSVYESRFHNQIVSAWRETPAYAAYLASPKRKKITDEDPFLVFQDLRKEVGLEEEVEVVFDDAGSAFVVCKVCAMAFKFPFAKKWVGTYEGHRITNMHMSAMAEITAGVRKIGLEPFLR